VTFRVKPREMMRKHIKVTAAIFTKGDLVLAMRRAPHKPLPGKWEFPGGKLEEGELTDEALIREIKEELDIDIYNLELFDHSTTILPDWEVELSCYLVQSDVEPTESTDHDQLIWLKREELESLDWSDADLPAVRKLIMS
jgi:8-oxo-dGTP diphosphatase